MKISRNFCLSLIMILLNCVTLFSQQQEQNPIKWRMTAKMTSETEGIITLKALIAPGWHLYGTELPKNGPIPTAINFDGSRGVKFIGKFIPSVKPQSHKDPNFGMMLNWWDKDVVFTCKFKLTQTIENAEINGEIRYMGCDDTNCLPPKTQTFKTKLKPYINKK